MFSEPIPFPKTKLRVVEVPKVARNLDRLVVGVLAWGTDNCGKLSAWSGLDDKEIREILVSDEFIELYEKYRGDSKLVLPSKSEVYALLRVEAESAEKSRDRQMALKQLLNEVDPSGQRDAVLENFDRERYVG